MELLRWNGHSELAASPFKYLFYKLIRTKKNPSDKQTDWLARYESARHYKFSHYFPLGSLSQSAGPSGSSAGPLPVEANLKLKLSIRLDGADFQQPTSLTKTSIATLWMPQVWPYVPEALLSTSPHPRPSPRDMCGTAWHVCAFVTPRVQSRNALQADLCSGSAGLFVRFQAP